MKKSKIYMRCNVRCFDGINGAYKLQGGTRQAGDRHDNELDV